jgi:hypothetical protein
MAVAIASTNSYTGASLSSIPIPAPNGIQVGDLLVIIAHTAGQNVTNSISTPTDFTLYDTNSVAGSGLLPECEYRVFYKYAVIDETSALTYTVTVEADAGYSGEIFRITGGPTSGIPFYTLSVGTNDGANDPTLTNTSLTLSRPTAQILLMTASAASNDAGETFSFSNETITSSDANPSWTELVDTYNNVDPSSISCSGGAVTAYATSTNTSTITAFSLDGLSSNANSSWAYGLYMICTPQSATGTNTLLSVSPANFSQNGVAGTTGTNALLEVSPEFPTQSGRGTTPTQWSNDTKPTTNWSNET